MTTAPAAASKTRDAIADALLDLLTEGNLRPTAKEIAAKAGVSVRSVYVHFDDLEDLFCVAAARHFARVAPMLEPVPATGPLAERADELVRHRARLYERLRGVINATQVQAPFSPTLQRIVRNAMEQSRTELERVFARELDALPADARMRALAAVDALTGPAAWESLRERYALDDDEARRSIAETIVARLQVTA